MNNPITDTTKEMMEIVNAIIEYKLAKLSPEEYLAILLGDEGIKCTLCSIISFFHDLPALCPNLSLKRSCQFERGSTPFCNGHCKRYYAGY